MAGRGRTSYQKRQKEQLRLERRQAKAARKQDRKLNKPEAGLDSDIEENPYLAELAGDDSDDVHANPRDIQDRL
jgi:hypothetical protein